MAEKEKIVLWVKAMQSGDPEAFEKLYNAYFQDVYYYILRVVNDAELASDLTQETFIEIYQNISKLKEPEAFLKWSKMIAYHKCTAHFRKKRDVLVEENEEELSIFDTLEEEREEFIPDEALDKDELKKTIQEIINALPEEQRAAIMMRYFDELSVQDIAEIQNVSEGTVKSRLNYGRKAIKNSVEEYEKKTGVKLRCTGVIPLLIWAFRGYWKVTGVTSTGGAAAIVASVKDGAVAAADSVGKAAVTEGVKTGTRGIATKVVVGVVAATVAIGGVFAATKVIPEVEEIIEEQLAEETDEEAISTTIYGTVLEDTLVLSSQPMEGEAESKEFPFADEETSNVVQNITKVVIEDDLSPETTSRWFEKFIYLETIEGLEKLHMEHVTDMSYMFFECESLTELDGLDDWNVSSVTNMSGMFGRCISLENVKFMKRWDVSSVTDMSKMFFGCSSLEKLDGLEEWNVSKVADMNGMFWRCMSLDTLRELEQWDVSNVTNMNRMFSMCSGLMSRDGISGWKVSEETDTTRMFFGCAFIEENENS